MIGIIFVCIQACAVHAMEQESVASPRKRERSKKSTLTKAEAAALTAQKRFLTENPEFIGMVDIMLGVAKPQEAVGNELGLSAQVTHFRVKRRKVNTKSALETVVNEELGYFNEHFNTK